MFSLNSSDKNKCYEVISKLSDIYQSDKEYLKVCYFKSTYIHWTNTAVCRFNTFFIHFYVYTQLAKVWLQLIQVKEEEAVDKKELLQLWQKMTQLLSDCLSEEEKDSETQKHV